MVFKFPGLWRKENYFHGLESLNFRLEKSFRTIMKSRIIYLGMYT